MPENKSGWGKWFHSPYVWKPIRIVSLIVTAIGFIISTLAYLYFDFNFLLLHDSIGGFIESLPVSFDWGGLLTLFLSLFVILVLGFPKSIKKVVEGESGAKLTIYILIGIIGVIGIWLAVRAIGLFIINYALKQAEISYQPNDVFNLLSYVIAANLPFTLIKAMNVSRPNNNQIQATNYNGYDDLGKNRLIQGLLDVVLQVILIGLITYIPNYGNDDFLKAVNGYEGYVIILFAIIVLFLTLIVGRGQIKSQE